MSQIDKTIGFIGLGAMGLPMARNLIEGGFKLRIYNRTKSKADELIKLGAEVVDSPAAAAADGIVVTMLANDAALAEIVTGKDGIGNALGQNGIHLSMSTISPQLARELAEFHAQSGADYVASPVSGRPDAAAAKQLTMWVSGTKAAKERMMPVIAAMGRGSSDVGEDPEALALHLKNEGLLGNSLEIIPLTEEDALVVAQLRPLTKTSGLSLGDRACLALGKRLRLPIFTADRTWASLNLAVQVQLIR